MSKALQKLLKNLYAVFLCNIAKMGKYANTFIMMVVGGGCRSRYVFPSRSEPAGQDRGPFGSWLLRCKMQKSGKAVSFSRNILLPRPILLQRHNHAKQRGKKKTERTDKALKLK